MPRFRRALAWTAALGLSVSGASAQQAAPAPAQPQAPAQPLSIELNKVTDTATGCRLTFVLTNGTGASVDRAAYEVAIFDTDNRVTSLASFVFNTLAIGKTKVAEFEYPNYKCGQLSRILVNNATECVVNGAPSSPLCLANLQTAAKGPISFNQ